MHALTSEEPRLLLGELLVDGLEDGGDSVLARLVPLDQHHLEPVVQVLDLAAHLGVCRNSHCDLMVSQEVLQFVGLNRILFFLSYLLQG